MSPGKAGNETAAALDHLFWMVVMRLTRPGVLWAPGGHIYTLCVVCHFSLMGVVSFYSATQKNRDVTFGFLLPDLLLRQMEADFLL